MFSERLGRLETSELWQLLMDKRAAGDEILDLTESNPTKDGWAYRGDEILTALSHPDVLMYEPFPRGHLMARRAVTEYYRRHDREVSPDDIFLTASTSEAYSFLFKLLCDPGDTVLLPRPCYPLFETLARLEGVEPVPYSLTDGPDDTLPPRCRAIIAIHPHNPTGAYVSAEHTERLLRLSEEHGIALIVDEVFIDYPIRREPAPSFAGGERGLVFVLSGLSKIAGLPQMKLGWIAIGGDNRRVVEANERLEHIADAFLSVGTPVQLAVPRLLDLAPGARGILRQRLDENLDAVEAIVDGVPEVTFPIPDGGWYATLRLPAIASADAWALDFLEHASVFLHPGSLFGFEGGAYVVTSLMSPECSRGVQRVLDFVSDRVDSPGE